MGNGGGTRHPTEGAQGRTPDAHARQWSELFPVFPVDLGLFPVPVGTEKFNNINGIRGFFWFVPGVPGKSGRPPEGQRPKGTAEMAYPGVCSAAEAGKFPGLL